MTFDQTARAGDPVCGEPRCPRFGKPESGGFCARCGRSTRPAAEISVVAQEYAGPSWAAYATATGMPGDPAGLGNRFLARLIDFIVVVFAPLVVLALIAPDSPDAAEAAGGTMAPAGVADRLFALVVLAWFLLQLLYEFVMLAAFQGQTLGKAMMKVQVVRLDGHPVGWGGAAARVYVRAVVSACTCGLGGLLFDISPLFDDGGWRRGWADKVASTVVIRAGA